MQRQRLAFCLFWSGVALLFVHTTLPALWQVFGFTADYPLAAADGILGISAGFTPPLGTALMLAAGFSYGSKSEGRGRR